MSVSGCTHNAALSQAMVGTAVAPATAKPDPQPPAQTTMDTVTISPEATAALRAAKGV